MSNPQISVVIPVYNEEHGLAALFQRLYAALDALNRSYEIIFINDGSRDRSAAMLREQYERRPDVTRVILFNGNFGQHMAIMAGFAKCARRYDRDARRRSAKSAGRNRQSPDSRLMRAMIMSAPFASCATTSAWRKIASRMMNRVRERFTKVRMTDQGCMLRAYSRNIIRAINECSEVNTYIPALAYTFARNPVEIEVAHAERAAGESKYSLYSLIRLNFDLITGFSLAPLQLFSIFGIVVSLLSGCSSFISSFAASSLGRKRKACSPCSQSYS